MVIPVDLESLPVFGLITLPSTYAFAGKVKIIVFCYSNYFVLAIISL